MSSALCLEGDLLLVDVGSLIESTQILHGFRRLKACSVKMEVYQLGFSGLESYMPVSPPLRCVCKVRE